MAQKTLQELQGEPTYEVEYMNIQLKKDKKWISGLFIDARVKPESVGGRYVYEIRHSDLDFGLPKSIEKSVFINFYGTLITEIPIEGIDSDKDFLTIKKSHHLSWAEHAEEVLQEIESVDGIECGLESRQLFIGDYWENLDTDARNIKRYKEMVANKEL